MYDKWDSNSCIFVSTIIFTAHTQTYVIWMWLLCLPIGGCIPNVFQKCLKAS